MDTPSTRNNVLEYLFQGKVIARKYCVNNSALIFIYWFDTLRGIDCFDHLFQGKVSPIIEERDENHVAVALIIVAVLLIFVIFFIIFIIYVWRKRQKRKLKAATTSALQRGK